MVQISPATSPPPDRAASSGFASPAAAAAPTRADATRRRILEAASRVFRRQGLAATGMRDIAAELGMTVGNLYYYFEDRRDLLAFCQETTLERLQALATRIESASAPADEKLRALIAGHVFELNEGVPGSLAHLEVEAIDEHRRPAILARREAYEETWRHVIAAGIASRAFRRVDPGTAARALLGACNWTVKWYRPGGERDAQQIGADFADLLVSGLAAPPGARAAAKSASSSPRSARKRGRR